MAQTIAPIPRRVARSRGGARYGNSMAIREFSDGHGIQWQVWDTQPTLSIFGESGPWLTTLSLNWVATPADGLNPEAATEWEMPPARPVSRGPEGTFHEGQRV